MSLVMDHHYFATTSDLNDVTAAFDFSNFPPEYPWGTATDTNSCEQQRPVPASESNEQWPTSSSGPYQIAQFSPNYQAYQYQALPFTSPLPTTWNSSPAPLPYENIAADIPRTLEYDAQCGLTPTLLGAHDLSVSPKTMPLSFAPDVQSQCESRKASTNRSRLSYEARAILDRWFEQNRSDPYLEKPEAEDLATETGLTVRQVRTYFANARARKLPPASATESSGDTSSRAQTETPRGSMDQEDQTQAPPRRRRWASHERVSISQQPSPMERFLHSSPEEEGIPEGIVECAAKNLEERRGSEAGSSRSLQKRKRNSCKIEVQSDIGRSSNRGSECSHSSNESNANRPGPRRGRKRQPDTFRLPPTSLIIRAPSDSKKIFQCTFCPRDFAHKYDWRRHEESVHFPQFEWICMPDNEPTILAASGAITCAFCDQPNPTPAHLESHNCSGCLATSRSQRAFTRKDKLLQHIGQVHKMSVTPRHLSTWSRPVDRDVSFWCGICGIRLTSWQERVDHISGHFMVGQTMQLWRGEPGNIRLGTDTSLPFSRGTSPAPEHSPALTFSGLPGPKPHMCTTGCGEHFRTHTGLVFHERQSHNIYRSQVMSSPPLLVPSNATTYMDLHYPVLATAPAATSYFHDFSGSEMGSTALIAPQYAPPPTDFTLAFDPNYQGMAQPVPIHANWSRRHSGAEGQGGAEVGLPGSSVSSSRGA
ncbi:hypothetical protein EJ05DRAFT_475002 [Pseudovirgaria hyperparasitica]|uniref:Homeobox domain-containing protein n=1 Tax=Pseudovirgaria hyperparasitica TaxID=470096 RepID=A0A6A6WAU0_9PEZI|nr:uncharacterized protein EJ05DRAFT_475002 [Pseudovirgaria hyperparasitica]KAF2759978.1 hypothetical protein EJ05DRAFT_475002 [Pseudovirgaria hyperparasitica]